ncbi:MAG: hypothetical protein AB1896_17965 [Thermodesulfobacteriota bacterium]
MDIHVIWDTLEKTIIEMDAGRGDWETNVQTVQAAILLLLEYPPEEIMSRVKGCGLPPKAVVSWLVWEALKIEVADREKLSGLCAYWNREMKGTYGDLVVPGLPRPGGL